MPGVPKDALYNFDPESNGYNLVDGSAFHIWDYVEKHAGLSILVAHAMKTWGPAKVSNNQLQHTGNKRSMQHMLPVLLGRARSLGPEPFMTKPVFCT